MKEKTLNDYKKEVKELKKEVLELKKINNIKISKKQEFSELMENAGNEGWENP